MPDTGSVIETKVAAFAKALNAKLETKRNAKIAELKKKGKSAADAEKAVVKVSFKLSKGKGSVSRTPQQQAEYVSGGTSWTCAGAHVVDKARHVLMSVTPPGKSKKVSWKLTDAFGGKDEHFMTVSEFKGEWKSQMSSQGLKNYKGGDGYGDGDGFHLELPDSKVPRSDKRVQACLLHYAKITRIDGKPKNDKFEKSWKSDLAPHVKKFEKQKEEEEAKKRKEELKALRFDGKITGKGSLLGGVSKDTTKAATGLGEILVPSPIDSGGMKAKPVTLRKEVQFDSLARDIFEFLGVAETSGYDIKLLFTVSYDAVVYDHLTQGFLKNLSVSSTVMFNTPAASAMKVTTKFIASVALKQSAKAPAGSVVFDYGVKSPINEQTGKVSFTIAGSSLK